MHSPTAAPPSPLAMALPHSPVAQGVSGDGLALDFVTAGVAQRQNSHHAKNKKQQDGFFVVEDLHSEFPHLPLPRGPFALYGVADGHGEVGEVSADYATRTLPLKVAESLSCSADVPRALTEAFLETDRLAMASKLPFYMSGTCVVACLVSAETIWTAWCGDCAAILCSSGAGTVVPVTADHNVRRHSAERDRIVAAGGIVSGDGRFTCPGAPGRLQVTRAMGDWWGKLGRAPLASDGPPPLLLAEPEVVTMARGHTQDLLILGSDGVFEFMPAARMMELAARGLWALDVSAKLSQAAMEIVAEVVSERWCSDDNSTALVVDLRRSPHKRPQAETPMSQASLTAPGMMAVCPPPRGYKRAISTSPLPAPNPKAGLLDSTLPSLPQTPWGTAPELEREALVPSAECTAASERESAATRDRLAWALPPTPRAPPPPRTPLGRKNYYNTADGVGKALDVGGRVLAIPTPSRRREHGPPSIPGPARLGTEVGTDAGNFGREAMALLARAQRAREEPSDPGAARSSVMRQQSAPAAARQTEVFLPDLRMPWELLSMKLGDDAAPLPTRSEAPEEEAPVVLECPWCDEAGPWAGPLDQAVEIWWRHLSSRHLPALGCCSTSRDVEPCLRCSRPCATKHGLGLPGNRLPSLAEHHCVCR